MNKYELDSVTPGESNDSKLWIRFFMDAEQSIEESEKAGRPIYSEKEFIEIRIPGDKDEIRVRPVRYSDTQMYPRQYAAFKQGLEQPVTGTPLDKLPFITKAQAAEMAGVGIKTAEQLRDMSDANAQKYMGASQLRAKVKAFLDAAEGAAPALKMQAELEKRDGEIELLKQMVEQQSRKLEEMTKSKRA